MKKKLVIDHMLQIQRRGVRAKSAGVFLWLHGDELIHCLGLYVKYLTAGPRSIRRVQSQESRDAARTNPHGRVERSLTDVFIAIK